MKKKTLDSEQLKQWLHRSEIVTPQIVYEDWTGEESCPKVVACTQVEVGEEVYDNRTSCLFAQNLSLAEVRAAHNPSLCIQFEGKRAVLRPN